MLRYSVTGANTAERFFNVTLHMRWAPGLVAKPGVIKTLSSSYTV